MELSKIKDWTKFKKALFEVIGYQPHWKQAQIHFHKENPDYEDNWTYMVACWGRRSGKTVCAAMEAIFQLCKPGQRVWVVAPTYSLTEKVFREIYQKLVIDQVLGDDFVVKDSFNIKGGSLEIRTKTGSWVIGKSAENPNSLVGEGLDFLIIDEAAKVSPKVWEQYLEPTLLDRKGRALMISTPEGHNWFHDKFLLGQTEKAIEAGWQSSHMKSEHNPYLDKSWIEAKRYEVTQEIFRQEYEASFEHHTGLIFKDFVDRLYGKGQLFNDSLFKPTVEHSHFRSLDPGANNPTACLWACVDSRDNIWVYDEYEAEGLLAEDHAMAISANTLYPIVFTVADPTAFRKSSTDGRADEDVYREHGIYLTKANNDVTYGLRKVASYLRATLEDRPDHPKLYIHQRCVKLRRQLLRYVWDDWSSAVHDKNAPDKPRKYQDHLVDCLRYLCAADLVDVKRYKYKREEIEEALEGPAWDGRPTTGVR